MTGLGRELEPQFGELIETQQDLAKSVNALGLQAGYQGRASLENAKIRADLLSNLGQHAQEAYTQRNEALQQLALANSTLSSIDAGVTGTNEKLDHFEQEVCSVLGDIGVDISHLTHEVVQTRVAIIEKIQQLGDMFLWAHRENMWIQRAQLGTNQQILFALERPAQTKAYELWTIGEKYRRIGGLEEAIELYKESLDSNPFESRNYFSEALIHLNSGNAESAKKLLSITTERAIDQPKIQAYTHMHFAKILMYEGDFNQAWTILVKALDLDATNLEIWYTLALCAIRLGNSKLALKCVTDLLSKKPKYAYKITIESAFAPIMPQIRQYMKKNS